MEKRKKITGWIILIALLVLTEVIKFFPEGIEKYYATGLYPFIGMVLRKSLGWIPISMGDVGIGLLMAWGLYKIFGYIKHFKKQDLKGKYLVKLILQGFKSLAFLYIGFYWIWGFNYYRLGSSYLMKLETSEYQTEEIMVLVDNLHLKLVQITRDSTLVEQSKTNNRETLAQLGKEAFESAATKYPFLTFKYPSLKPNLIGKWQGYTGYAGYMFPFTGEAHVNFYAPSYSLPFSVCHEMAHQAGFGPESEANLVAFLTARESRNLFFQYSAYSGVYIYALSELYNRDSVLAKNYYNRLPEILKKDRKEMQKYLQEHTHIIQPVIDRVYEWYLQSQQQSEGLASYNYVVAWLIAYGKKYGWEAL